MAVPLGETTALQVDDTLLRDIVEGLTREPKQLPSKYHYDALGSQLFEAICELPWYTITRSERALFTHERDNIISRLSTPATMIELGAGSGEKVAILADGLATEQRPTVIHLIDISKSALELATRTVGSYPSVSVVQHEETYTNGLRAAVHGLGGDHPAMVLFLGSNIGNLSADAAGLFLSELRAQLRPGDSFLLGADLVKAEADLIAAYNDPLGVTAAFNLNMLVRINRELDADFDVAQFIHRVVWNAHDASVESYLVSERDQTVCITRAGCCVRLAAGEAIWTESSHKYEPDQLVSMGETAGFRRGAQWIESSGAFALTLFEVS